MRITIVAIGRFENSDHKLVFQTYLKRLKWKVALKEFDLKNSHNLAVDQIKKGEGELIAKAIKSSSKLIALDEGGKSFSSKQFAKMISDFAIKGDSDLSFVIGGANGLAEEILQKADVKISLSAMTFPHLMVRSILVEQIYRAQSIIEGHPYHRE